MVPRPQSSAAGVLALLVEQEPLLKQHALKTLISLVPQFWAEISEHIAIMYVLDIHPNVYGSQEYSESLYESPDLPIEARNSAALLASKAYYYLEEYIEARVEEQPGAQAKIDPRLQDIIESIFSHCIRNGEYKQVSPSRVSILPSHEKACTTGYRYLSRISSSGHNRGAIREDPR